ncbi:hypothetical protein [Prochlorococcus sp. MIT 0604]|uniref:hypothetical protein n=1 Tax=Prochlorococcus sp. MIT 0604 TaxID=1501268 RepID=UPI0004F80AFB|nr:hypothetical protein [Prochlorococcus sp. MIT 0604]AIQ96011.1 hypothetical protein EW14_2004 [Prochlorococcus sp. MIT 0604]
MNDKLSVAFCILMIKKIIAILENAPESIRNFFYMTCVYIFAYASYKTIENIYPEPIPPSLEEQLDEIENSIKELKGLNENRQGYFPSNN